jgi:hypothetical protein
MTKPPDFDALVDALRSDVPDAAERERVRARLLAAGAAVGASIVAPSSAAAAAQVAVTSVTSVTHGSAVASGAQASVLAHATGMSLSAKLGVLAVVVAAGASVPVARHLYERPEQAVHAEVRSQARAPIAAAVPRADKPALPNAVAPLVQERVQEPVQEPVQERVQEPGQAAAPLQLAQPQTAKRRAAATTATIATIARPQPAPTAADSTPAVVTPTPEPRTAAAVTSVSAPTSAPKAATQSTLHDEADLLGRALAALRANDREGARAALAAHAQRYPHGMLERERDRVAQRIDAAPAEQH